MGQKKVRRKLVVVGDGACGKTALLFAYSKGEFVEGHDPTIFDTYAAEIESGKTTVELMLWDTAGQEDFDRLRTISYNNTDVILICYSVDNDDSFGNVVEKWVPEVRHYCPRVPFLLVGCKKDLRSKDLLPGAVSETRGQQRADFIGAHAFRECSAKSREGVTQVFEEATKCTLRRKPHRFLCALL